MVTGTPIEYRYNSRSQWKPGRVYKVDPQDNTIGVEYYNDQLWLEHPKTKGEGKWYFYRWLNPANVRLLVDGKL